MSGIRFGYTPPEAMEQFRQIVRTALEREGELSPALRQRLEQKARELGILRVDMERVLQEVMALPSVQAASARRKAVVISPQNAAQVMELARWGKGTVKEIALSPDGRLLAVASSLGIYLYDAETLREVRFIETDARVNSVAFSPDGQIMASGSADKTVRLWRVADGSLLRTLEGHTDGVQSVTFSPDGAILATGSFDHTVRLWRVADGRPLHILERPGDVSSMAISPDGQTLASASGGAVWLWRVSDGVSLGILQPVPSYENVLAFSPDGTTLACGWFDHTVQLRRVSDHTPLRTLSAYPKNVTDASLCVGISGIGMPLVRFFG